MLAISWDVGEGVLHWAVWFPKVCMKFWTVNRVNNKGAMEKTLLLSLASSLLMYIFILPFKKN